MVLSSAVGEIHPHHVDPCGQKRPQDGGIRTRGSQSGDDLRGALHCLSPGCPGLEDFERGKLPSLEEFEEGAARR
jgi:hypothetical protein